MYKERNKKRMAYSINGKLKVAVSSRALFQLEKEDEIFLKKGKEAYERYQVKHEKDILQPGAAFPVVKALLELGEDDVEVIVVSRNTADTSLRVFNSIKYNTQKKLKKETKRKLGLRKTTLR